ncbi:MAG: type II toxin-antitoxin system Phd/YefM family antitoxin [Desulfomonilaceae bacterium]
MAMKTTYTQARANLAALWDQVTSNREIVIIQRRGAEDVALISLEELTGLLETVHLIKSPTNADRLLTAYDRAMKGQGISRTVSELRESFGLDE